VDRQNASYQGVALVLHSYIASLVTDLWGPVPYSQAWTGSTYLSPAYDPQNVIYDSLMIKLDRANNLLDPAEGEPISGDILFNGDLMKWKKFANSLRLRLLLRMSGVSSVQDYVTAEMTKILADPAKYPIFESNADNAALQYLGSAPNNHPWNENRKTRDDHRVSETLIDQMWNDTPYLDWRLALYADVDGNGEYVGMPNGLTSSQAASFNGNGIKYTCKVGAFFTSATCPGMLMSYAELQFILAEAAFKGFIGGSAEDYYYGGIYGSYNQFGDALIEAAYYSPQTPAFPDTWTTDSLAADFLVNDPSYAWDPANAMELIGKQKWAAMYDQGLQAFIEWRRIGFPVLEPGAEAVNPPDNAVPVRFPYPTDEYARNKTNLDAGVVLLGGPDDLNTRVWWDVD